jgi:hypothetical protein
MHELTNQANDNRMKPSIQTHRASKLTKQANPQNNQIHEKPNALSSVRVLKRRKAVTAMLSEL